MLLSVYDWSTTRANTSEVILFLHGMGGVGWIWRPHAAQLEERYRVIAFDQRGHGKSFVPPEDPTAGQYSSAQYGKDILETLDSLKIDRLWIVGHSMGVRSTLNAAALAPHRIKGLVLVDLGLRNSAGGGFGERLVEFLKKLPMEFPSRVETRNYLKSEAPDFSIAQYLLAVSILAPDQTTITFPFEKEALLESMRESKNRPVFPLVESLAEKNVPILALRGETSNAWFKEDYLEEKKLLEKYPSVKLEEFSGTGHGLPFEKRTEFLERLERFVQHSSK